MKKLWLIDLIHSDPLFLKSREFFEVNRGTTQDSLRFLLSGETDYAMISLVDYFKNKDILKLQSGPTITGKTRSNSNLLISSGDDPIERMKISVTKETETTAFYLRLVLDKLFPESTLERSEKTSAEDLLNENKYALIIGDKAMNVYRTNYKIILDVTHMMSRLYSFYSVYAVTASLRDCEDDKNLEKLCRIPSWEIRREIQEIAKRRDVAENLLTEYYNVISYDFNPFIKKNIDIMEKIYEENRDRIFSGDRKLKMTEKF